MFKKPTTSQSSNKNDYVSWRFLGAKNIVVEDGITSIGSSCFYNFYELEHIKLPDSLKTIGKYAFSDCYGLKSVDMPDDISSIESYAFEYCYSLEDITLPKNADKIGNYAFLDCYELKNIVIPSSVSEINKGTFCGCKKLMNVVIPSLVTNIGNYAFWGCAELDNIVIPISVKQIGEDVFKNTNSNFILYGEEGSYVQSYARNNNLKFANMDQYRTDTTETNTNNNIISGIVNNEGTPPSNTLENDTGGGTNTTGGTSTTTGGTGNTAGTTATQPPVSSTPTPAPASTPAPVATTATNNTATSPDTKVQKGTENQSIKCLTKSINVNYDKLKKKNQKSRIKASAKTSLSFKKLSGSKAVSVANSGKVTVKSGLKKGVYKVKVKMIAKKSSNYNATSKIATISVKVK